MFVGHFTKKVENKDKGWGPPRSLALGQSRIINNKYGIYQKTNITKSTVSTYEGIKTTITGNSQLWTPPPTKKKETIKINDKAYVKQERKST